MSILICIVVLISCFKRPMLGLAFLLQINIIRGVSIIDYINPCWSCGNPPDMLLGAITPILGFVIILLRLELKRPIKYVLDVFDGFFILAIFILFFTSIYAFNIAESLDYSLRFLFIGSGFFFITKIILINSNEYINYVKSFLLYSLWLAIVFGTIGCIVYLSIGYGHGAYRMTIPSVHPIPFSQLIGLGIITSFLMFITNGDFFNIKSKIILNLNKLVFLYLVLLLFATQTRGVILSLAVAIFFYLTLSRVKIKKRTLYVSGIGMILALIVAIQYIDFKVLFSRLESKKTEKSVGDRLIAYQDSLTLFLENPFGIGPDAFKHYSILPYPHNLFLEFLSQYGIFGLFISIYLIFIIVFMSFITYKLGKRNLFYIILFALFIYYFIEAMFSFTLWMHKGMFFSIGLFAGFHYRAKQKKLTDSV